MSRISDLTRQLQSATEAAKASHENELAKALEASKQEAAQALKAHNNDLRELLNAERHAIKRDLLKSRLLWMGTGLLFGVVIMTLAFLSWLTMTQVSQYHEARSAQETYDKDLLPLKSVEVIKDSKAPQVFITAPAGKSEIYTSQNGRNVLLIKK